MRFFIPLCTLFFIAAQMMSCTATTPKKIICKGETQGTYYQVTYFDEQNRDFQLEIDSMLTVINHSLSIYDTSSFISRFNNNALSLPTDTLFLTCIKKALEVSKYTQGAFDVTAAPFFEFWGFGKNDKGQTDTSLIPVMFSYIGYEKIILQENQLIKKDPRLTINLNAIAQGYTTDIVAQFLTSKQIKAYLVDVGGEIYAKGMKPKKEPWQVGIEKPAKTNLDEQQVQQVVSLTDKALATSGNYRKYKEEKGKRYGHSINPITGFPAKNNLLSVSVMATTAMEADAYATAFMVMGHEKAQEFIKTHPFLGLEAYFILADSSVGYEITYTKGFKKWLKK